MCKKTLSLALAAILIATTLGTGLVGSVLAAGEGDRYRIVLRYYDKIQITYNIKYPVGDSRDEWEGDADVPIGGVGVPDPAKPDDKFAINPFICTQIYCADPFVPFHGRVPDFGGDYLWNGGGMADVVSGYVSAAPWNMSGAMLQHGEAVGWIATNGYRGTYNYGKADNDPESVASVKRLNLRYYGSETGPIDREIAVMATKVAIWKTIAGDSIKVLKTTLDDRPASKKAFNDLVDALVRDGKNPPKDGPMVGVTKFDVAIVDEGTDYVDEGAYFYYGPLHVEATLDNPYAAPGVVAPVLDKVYMAISGPQSDGVIVSTNNSGAPVPISAPGTVYGMKGQQSRYFDAKSIDGGNFTAGVWKSPDFYIAVPAGRTPPQGDSLLLRAMAGSQKVPVVGGTPIVFTFADNNNVQDWDAIQAYVGGALDGAQVDMFAEDSWYTGNTSLGELRISKTVENFSVQESDQEFTFAVYYNDNNGTYPAAPDFATARRLDLSSYPVRGTIRVNSDNTFTLKNGGMAVIKGLPMLVSGGGPEYEYQYWVEEIKQTGFDLEYGPPHFAFSDGNPPINGTRIGPFRLNANTNVSLVSVTNTRLMGSIFIEKRLEGLPQDWGVDNATFFSVRVKDSKGNYLLFRGTGPVYECYGNNSTGDVIKISANQRVTLTNIWTNDRYMVEEVDGDSYNVVYGGDNGVLLTPSKDNNVTVTNNFDHRTQDLIIRKELAGYPEDWGVDDSTVFSVRVKDVTNNNYLLFKGTGPVYECYGNSGSGDSSTGDIIKVSAGQPATITNLWVGAKYEVEEIDVKRCKTTYVNNGPRITEGRDSVVTVVNTYDHGTGYLIINKKLAGSYEDWGVDEVTVFYAKVKDITNDNYLMFKAAPEEDGSYRCIGNTVDGLSEPYTGSPITEVPFSAGQSAVISNLYLSAEYKVEEVSYPNSKPETGSGTLYTPGQNCVITVTNTFDHGTGALVISKKLAGSYEDWIVGDSKEFKVKIKDTGDTNYLLFKAEKETDGSYWCVGNDVAGLTEEYDGATLTELPVTAECPLIVKHLWINHKYEVEELDGNGYTAEYVNNGARYLESRNSNITVVNMYKHGTESLTVKKELAGSYADWGVDENKEFKVKIKDLSDGNYLLFEATPREDGIYWCVGNDVAGVGEGYTGATITELPVSSKNPLTVSNLWMNHEFEVIELGGNGYTTTYKNNGGILVDGEGNIVTVINTYGKPDKPVEPGEPDKPDKPDRPSRPNTSDDSNINLWLCLGGASLLGLGGVVVTMLVRYRAKTKKQQEI